MSEQTDPIEQLRRLAREQATPWGRSRARKRAGLPPLRRAVAECGTLSAARRHRRLGEPVCDECKAAWRRYERERYQPTGRPPGRPRID
jgi:hypothetical protein